VQTLSGNISELTNDTTVTKEISTNESSTSNPLINDTTDTEEVSINATWIQIVKKGGRAKGLTSENMRAKARNLQQETELCSHQSF
jgi:hypothetical protein